MVCGRGSLPSRSQEVRWLEPDRLTKGRALGATVPIIRRSTPCTVHAPRSANLGAFRCTQMQTPTKSKAAGTALPCGKMYLYVCRCWCARGELNPHALTGTRT